MRLPVKDRVTAPYMTEREIPAVKAALSAWRKLRRDAAMFTFGAFAGHIITEIRNEELL